MFYGKIKNRPITYKKVIANALPKWINILPNKNLIKDNFELENVIFKKLSFKDLFKK